jgi:hypothetical protein
MHRSVERVDVQVTDLVAREVGWTRSTRRWSSARNAVPSTLQCGSILASRVPAKKERDSDRETETQRVRGKREAALSDKPLELGEGSETL